MNETSVANTRCVCRTFIIIALIASATITIYNVLSIGSFDRIRLAEIAAATFSPVEPLLPPHGKDKDL